MKLDEVILKSGQKCVFQTPTLKYAQDLADYANKIFVVLRARAKIYIRKGNLLDKISKHKNQIYSYGNNKRQGGWIGGLFEFNQV